MFRSKLLLKILLFHPHLINTMQKLLLNTKWPTPGLVTRLCRHPPIKENLDSIVRGGGEIKAHPTRKWISAADDVPLLDRSGTTIHHRHWFVKPRPKDDDGKWQGRTGAPLTRRCVGKLPLHFLTFHSHSYHPPGKLGHFNFDTFWENLH